MLDASQLSFCNATDEHIRLLAPAGCGKTHCILHRCLSLKDRANGKAVRILTLTFTGAARDEIRSRLHSHPAFAAICDDVEVTTLNAWGYRRIKSQTQSPQIVTNKGVLYNVVMNQLQSVWMEFPSVRSALTSRPRKPTTELVALIDGFKSLGFDHVRHTDFNTFKAHIDSLREQELEWRFQDLADELVALQVLGEKGKRGSSNPLPSTDAVYKGFYRFWLKATRHLMGSATFTLEDQKYFAYLDERQKADEQKALVGAAKYDHVIVDEFQDINPLDINLIKAIVDRSRASITVVGDDDQAIYEWRGTTPSYILQPEKYFDRSFATFTLSTNYRSPANIVKLSQQLISGNRRRVAKFTQADRNDEAKIDLYETDDIADALEIAFRLHEAASHDSSSSNRIALIGRKQAQLIPYQIYFAAKNIPFYAAEDLQIFLSKTFDRLLELLDLKQSSDRRVRSYQVVEDLIKLCQPVKRFPLSIGDKNALENYLSATAGSSVVESVKMLGDYSGPLKGPNARQEMSRSYASSLTHFLTAKTVHDALVVLSEEFEGLQADFGKGADDIFFKDPPFGQLAEFARRYGDDYIRFLDDIETAKRRLAHVPSIGDDGASLKEGRDRPLHLLTALRAKGKEYDTVMLLDCNEGIWPNRNVVTISQLEAERRVFYVAFTRAKKRVVIQTSNKIGKSVAQPSRFLREMGLNVSSSA